MNIRNKTSVLAVAVALVAAFIYPASADQQLTKKWFPGHYINSSNSIHSSGSHISQQARNLLAENPGFVGVKMAYFWYELETAFGVYDFSQLVADLDYAHSLGKKVHLVVRERQYAENGPYPLPAYMAVDPIYEGGVYSAIQPVNQTRSYWPKIWLQPVAERWAALWTALGPVIDSHPALAVISTQETAYVEIRQQPGFNQATLHSNLINIHKAIANAFPNTVYTPYLNYAGGLSPEQREEQMLILVGGKKIGIGDPDMFHRENKVTVLDKNYAEYWIRYKGIIPFGGESQNSSYEFNSAREIYDFVVDTLGLNFMTWAPVTPASNPKAAFYFTDVITLLNEKNFRINTTPPSNLLVDGVPISPPENVRVISD